MSLVRPVVAPGDRAEDLFDAEDSGGDASGCEAESVECDFCDCSP